MWTQQYDIFVETLTGSQFEVTVTEKDTVGYIKSRIQKYEGIPVDQQHLIYNHKELLDKTEIKDIPLVKGSTVKLVLDMKGGPVSARRVVTLPGYDKWFDLSDVLSHAVQDSLPMKLLVYKDCKKNIHRVMKLRADRKNMMARNQEVPTEFSRAEDDTHDDQWRRDNMQTLEKMGQLKFKLDSKKRKSNRKNKNKPNDGRQTADDVDDKVDNQQIHHNHYRQADKFKEFLMHDNRICHDDDIDEKLNLEIPQYGMSNHGNHHSSSSNADNCFRLDSEACDFSRQINSELDDMFLMSGLILSDEQIRPNKSSSSGGPHYESKPFSLSPRRPTKLQDKSNFSRFFHHRNSSPTLNSSVSPMATSSTSSSSMILSSPPIMSSNTNNSNTLSTSNFEPLNSLDKNKKLSQSCNYISESRSNKLRDNIRRNRSFKLIDNDLIIEENETPNPRVLSASPSATSVSNETISTTRPATYKTTSTSSMGKIRPNTSASVQDLIEHITFNKFNSQNDVIGSNSSSSSNNNNIGDSCETVLGSSASGTSRCPLSLSNNGNSHHQHKLNKRWNGPSIKIKQPSSSSTSTPMNTGGSNGSGGGGVVGDCNGGYENKFFMDKDYTLPMVDSSLDNSFRFYKMSSDAKNCYELPKLLIREDSPVETYQSSDSQIETIALRGNSPKNVMDTFRKIQEETTAETKLEHRTGDGNDGLNACDDDVDDDDDDDNESDIDAKVVNQQANSLLKLYDTPNQPVMKRENPIGATTAAMPSVDVKLRKSVWNYHNSDLGLNQLELNFFNDDHHLLSGCGDRDLGDHLPSIGDTITGSAVDMTSTSSPSPSSSSTCLRKSNNSALKIAASNLEINKWKSISQFNGGKPPESTASLNFINGDLSSDDEDNDDVFNSCELLHHNNKSKSVELNEFRMMFGSSPTLLNTNNYNYNPISQTSRLDAVPFQYRRGYSNLNDACLSSSTSDLECFQQSSKKKVFNKNKNELPSLYRHRNNEHLDYIRSYENLDRTRIVRMRNDRVPTSANGTAAATAGGIGSGGGINGNGASSCSNKNGGGTTATSGLGSGGGGGRDCFNLSRDRCLQEEDDSYDDFSSYSNLCFDNDTTSIGCIGTGNINRKLKKNNDPIPGIGELGFPSDESIFNINFDHFEDDVLEIDTRRLFDSSIGLETPTGATHLNPCTVVAAAASSTVTTTTTKSNTLLLPDINSTRNLSNSQAVTNHVAKINAGIDGSEGDSNQLSGENSKKSSKKKPRCAQCNKKLGVIMVMKCHCENVFCAQHRYAEAHNCTYNFKQEGKKILAKENPLVVAQKLPKI